MAINLPASVAIKASVSGQSSVDSLRNSVKGVSQSTKELSDGFKGAATAVKTFLAAYVANQAVSFLKNIIDTADSLKDLAQQTGYSVSVLSKLKTAAELNGVSFEGLQVGLKKFGVNLVEASVGSGKAEGAFKKLGIEVRDGNRQLKPASELLLQVSDKFKDLKDGPEKAALAVRLFGKSGTDLVQVLSLGRDELLRFGLALDDDFADRADQFNDTISLMNLQFQNLGIGALQKLLPPLQQILDAFLKMPDAGKDMIGIFDIIGEVFRYLAVGAQTVVTAFLVYIDSQKAFISTLIDGFSTAGQAIKDVISGNFSNVGSLAKGFLARSEGELSTFIERSKKRLGDYAAFVDRVGGRSFIAGLIDGKSVEQIRKENEDDTRVPVRKKGGRLTAPVVDEESTKKIDSAIEATRKKIAMIYAETEALGKNETEKKIILELQELENRGLNKNTKAYKELADELEIAISYQEEIRKELAADPWRGAKKSLDDYVRSTEDLASLTGNAITHSLNALEDAFVDFFTTGKLQWRSFANAIIAEIIRIQVKRAIIAPIANGISAAFGFADGGVMTSEGPLELKRYARGGIANTPQLAMFGEGTMPEAYVPLPDGRRIPVAMQGTGGVGPGSGGNVSVVVNVNGVSGSGSGDTSSSASDQKAGELGRLIAAAVRNEIITQKRPGGMLAS